MATNAEATVVAPNMIELRQDGKTMYLRLRSRLQGDAMIWQPKYLECEQRVENLRVVGFVLNLRANESAEVEVTLSTERGKNNILQSLGIGRRKKK
jgi:hypothetical protein